MEPDQLNNALAEALERLALTQKDYDEAYERHAELAELTYDLLAVVHAQHTVLAQVLNILVDKL